MQKKPGAVVTGGDFQALGVIRSLAEKKIPVILLEHEKGIGRYSRHVHKIVKNHKLFSDGMFVESLIRIAKEESLEGWVLFPNNDECVKLLSIHRNELQKWYKISVPAWDVIKQIYYKEGALQAAERASVPIPKLYRGGYLDDYLQQKIEFPIVLKPSCKERYFPRTKKKAVRVDTLNEFVTEFQAMSAIIKPDEIVVQEMILGGPKNLYSYATVFDNGKILAGMAARRLRQHPMDFGHATTYAVSVCEPELKILAEKLLNQIGYSGIAEVEFMLDEKDGRFKFIEINGRPWGWNTLAKASGLNLPFLIYQHLTGEKMEEVVFEAGVKWIRLITDMPTVFKELMMGRMKLHDYWNSLKGKKEFAVFSLKDPLPFFVEYAMIPYLWRKRGF